MFRTRKKIEMTHFESDEYENLLGDLPRSDDFDLQESNEPSKKAPPRDAPAKGLEQKSISNPSSCSSTLYHQNKNLSNWKKILLATGCNKEALNKVIMANVIQDFRILSQSLAKIALASRKNLQPWELYCLCGELPAMKQAVKEGLTKHTKNSYDENALELAALSGSALTMDYAFKELGIEPTKEGWNVLHVAALSNSIPAIQYALEVLKIDPSTKTSRGNTAWDMAKSRGSTEAAAFLKDVLKPPIESNSRPRII